MDRPRWPMIAAACVGALALLALGWVGGRATAPSSPTRQASARSVPVRFVDGAPIGVEHSRVGALAAADNYVATSSQTIAQDPDAFKKLIRAAWMREVQAKILADAVRYREAAADALQNYADGGRGISVVGARKLESYTAANAKVLTWGGGLVWGPAKKPTQRWYLVRTKLAWVGDRWRVLSLNELKRPAPVPYSISSASARASSAATFDSALAGMSAPIYGTGG